MKPPKSVRIGCINYSLEFCPIGESEVNVHNNFGKCRQDPATIVIATPMQDGRVAEVFMHEVLHAIWNEFSLDRIEKQEEGHEESYVEILGPLLAMFCKDNPKAMGWYLELLT